MSKVIEVFVDETEHSKMLMQQVRENACSKCTIVVHEMNTPHGVKAYQSTCDEQGSFAVPAVVIDGRVVDHARLANLKKNGPGS